MYKLYKNTKFVKFNALKNFYLYGILFVSAQSCIYMPGLAADTLEWMQYTVNLWLHGTVGDLPLNMIKQFLQYYYYTKYRCMAT